MDPKNDKHSLVGLRVCSFESRKGAEMRALIERQGGIVTIAPSMREVPLTENPAAFTFAERQFAGDSSRKTEVSIAQQSAANSFCESRGRNVAGRHVFGVKEGAAVVEPKEVPGVRLNFKPLDEGRGDA